MKAKAYSYIRFSTKEQEKGDSLRRQTEGTEEIAKLLNLELDTTLRIDRGLSSFTGDNRTKGALGEFIKLVDEKKIAVGSCLIIEHFDRLTRQGMTEAIHLLTGLLLKGIDLYTKMDNKHFTKDTFDAMDLITSAIILQQGHDESVKKRIRAREFWHNKREDARNGKRKLTRECPMWLEPVGRQETPIKFVTTGYKPVPERVAVIKLIFKMKLSGKGSDRIAKELNQTKGIWKPKKGNKENSKQPAWTTSTIEFILNGNRSLLGEFQPHRYTKVEDKRVNVPEGEPILNYFPVIIDVDLFNRVQKIIRDNAKQDGRGGGRGNLANNLFSHIAICGTCGNTMRYLNRGGNPNVRQFRCANALVGLCNKTKLHYVAVEHAVLTFCKGLDVANILPNSEKAASELSILQNQLQAKEFEVSTLEITINNTLIAAGKTDNEAFHKGLEHMFSILNINLDKLKKEKQDIQDQITQLEGNGVQTEEQIKSIKELIDKMKDMTGEERLNLRLNLRSQLRRLIKTIKVNASDKTIIIFFHSGQRRLINIVTSEIVLDAYPKKYFKK